MPTSTRPRPARHPLPWLRRSAAQAGARFALAAALLAPVLRAQETPAQRHQMATNQLKQIVAELSERCLEDVRTLEDWTRQKELRRRQLLEMLGLDPLPARTPLRPQITGTLERPAYRIEKLVFQSSPGLYVTANFYLPHGSVRGQPAVLYLCGHSPDPAGAKVDYQNRAQWFASHGYPCLVLDTLEFAEVAGLHHGTHNLNLWNWFSLGYNPAGVEVWNAMRALDYLETRPEVDPKRIGLTGISGGGAMTWFTAAVDERVAAAAPVCSTYTFGSQAAHWVAAGQCDCIYYNNTHLWDFPVVGALIAPRPLLILSGQKDGIFPPDGYHAVYQRSKRIYDLYAGGNSDRIREVDDNVGHSDPPLFLGEARQWMQRWLKQDPTPIQDHAVPDPEPPASLAVLKELPSDAANFGIHNRFVALPSLKRPANRTAWEERRSALTAGLHEKVFKWFPQPGAPFETAPLRGSAAYMNRYADYREATFATEPGARVRVQLLLPKTADAANRPLLIYAKRAGDSVYFVDTDELLPLAGRCSILILHPRFTETTPGPNEFTNIERTAVWAGRTIGAMQIWDILRALDWAVKDQRLPHSSVAFYGKGHMGVLGLYAALLDHRIGHVVLNDPPGSHWQAPALLNVLRVTDIPEIAGALAPRRVSSLTPFPESFSLTRDLFRIQRSSASLRQTDSLAAAMAVWK